MASAASSSSSASSYPPIPDVMFTSASNLTPIKLKSTNYFIWKHITTTLFSAHGVRGYIDGTITPPPKFLSPAAADAAPELSPVYRLWRQRDAGARSVLHATLSDSALNHIIGPDTARELWLTLEMRFTAMSGFNIMKYRSDLQTIRKGSDSVHTYAGRINDLRSKLTGFGVRIDDAEMIDHAMAGLPDEYQAFRNLIAARNEPLYLHQFFVLLLAAESEILGVGNQ